MISDKAEAQGALRGSAVEELRVGCREAKIDYGRLQSWQSVKEFTNVVTFDCARISTFFLTF